MSERTVLALVPPLGEPAAQGRLRAGQTLEQRRRYRLVEVIGEGGMGTIWRAFDEALEREVAIKFLKADVPADYRRRFRREARLGASFDHPNLVRVLDAGARSRDGDEWMAMDLLAGHDLGALIETHGRLGVPVLLDGFRQALAALAHVHDRRVIHRDVKPFNLFLSRSPARSGFVLKLIDFGICRNLAVPEPADVQLVGDPRYMAPEQATLGVPLDGRADLYALGLTLVQAATGRHPFEAWFSAPVSELLRAHRRGLPWRPSDALPGGLSRGFGEVFDEVVARACAVDPGARYPDAQAMLEGLEALARAARHGA
ncbi:MAG: serine/threonine protein kinase [Nannocystaceae bacterium]|nr:serine/threonine protein kinase [Nannocystaceae bacterium]